MADVAVLMDWKHLLLRNLKTPLCEAKLRGFKRGKKTCLPSASLTLGLVLKWGAVKWKAQQ